MRTLAGVVLALALTACGAGSGATDGGGGKACTTSTDCGMGAYCAGTSRACPGASVPSFTEGAGSCHLACGSTPGCCHSAADCRGLDCRSDGSCAPQNFACASPTCPSGCTSMGVPDQICPVCVCAACP